jgi:hypothetical protein
VQNGLGALPQPLPKISSPPVSNQALTIYLTVVPAG